STSESHITASVMASQAERPYYGPRSARSDYGWYTAFNVGRIAIPIGIISRGKVSRGRVLRLLNQPTRYPVRRSSPSKQIKLDNASLRKRLLNSKQIHRRVIP